MRIKKLQLLSANLEETFRFYNELLQLPVVDFQEDQLSLKAGDSMLIFCKTAVDQPVYHFAFNIPQNQFEEALQWVSSKLDLINVTASGPVADFTNWNAKAFYLYDNNRNIVELIARYKLPNSAATPFTGTSICSVSEIGIVVKDTTTFTGKILRQYQLGYFAKQPPMEDFKAVGNDEGLFIIVPPGRNWYPTQVASAMHWIKVQISNPGQLHEMVIHERVDDNKKSAQ